MAEKIPGIFNYCDRWCERCAFTSHCEIYDQELKMQDQPDINDKLFWERLSANFGKAKDMLFAAAEKHGIDLKEIEREMPGAQQTEAQLRQGVNSHDLAGLSMAYFQRSDQWLRSKPGLLKKLEELNDLLAADEDNLDEAKGIIQSLQEAIDVISWYQSFIHVKLKRALMGKARGPRHDIQSDFNGSAKIALIAIGNSIKAWETLFAILPDNEDEFLERLGMLEKLQRMTQEEFPHAQEFQRPGFDLPY